MPIWDSREACFARKNPLVKFGAFGSVGSGFVGSMAEARVGIASYELILIIA